MKKKCPTCGYCKENPYLYCFRFYKDVSSDYVCKEWKKKKKKG